MWSEKNYLALTKFEKKLPGKFFGSKKFFSVPLKTGWESFKETLHLTKCGPLLIVDDGDHAGVMA